MDNRVKFIWISDIHFKETYSTKSNYEKFKGVFYTKINKILEQDFDTFYFLITGDVAYQGNSQEYEAFKVFILDCFDKNSASSNKIRVLFCPGNHDISHDNLITLYKDKLKYGKEGASTLIDYFKNRDPNSTVDVENLFEAYTKALGYNKNNSNKNFQSYLISDKSGSVEVSDRYKDTAMEGYVFDNKNKVIFIILNTAWFSFGSSVEKFLEGSFTKSNEGKKRKIKYNNLIKLLKYSQEAGRLKTRINEAGTAFPYEELEKKMKNSDYQDYTIITMMHHPPEFLDWEEINSYKYESTNLYKLLEKSHLLLTGHVHPPRNVRYESMYEDVLHLRAPLFLSHDDEKENTLFPQNGFVDFEFRNDTNSEKAVSITYHNINCTLNEQNIVDIVIKPDVINLKLTKTYLKNSNAIKDFNPHKIDNREIIIFKPNFD